MTQQTDLFGRLAVAPVQGIGGGPSTIAPLAREFIPTPPTLEWAKLLARSEFGHNTTILVSALWTGVVVECLSDPQLGRLLLYRDKCIQPIAQDRGAFGRIVYLDVQRVLELHARHPLILIGAGTHAASYRFARPDEGALVLLPLPGKVDDCE